MEGSGPPAKTVLELFEFTLGFRVSTGDRERLSRELGEFHLTIAYRYPVAISGAGLGDNLRQRSGSILL